MDRNSLSKDLYQFLKKLQKLKIFDFIERTVRWNDYPRLYQYTVFSSKLRKRGGGFDLCNKELAIRKSISEFIEIYSLVNVNKNKVFKAKYESLKGKAIPLEDLIIPYQNKAQRIRNLLSEKDIIYFTEGFDILKNKKVFIPAHLVYFPIKFKEKKLIREPNSNGASTHVNLKNALIKSIFELIERDSFFVYYLNNLLGEPLEVDDSSTIKNIIKIFKKYRLELYIFYQPTDINVFNITSLAIDKSGLSVIVGVGSSSDINLDEAIIKSLIEVVQILNWGRGIITFSKKSASDTLEFRAFYWSDLKRLPFVYQLINNSFKLNKKPVKTSSLRKKIKVKPLNSSSRILDYLLNNLAKLSMDVYYSEITPIKLKKIGLISVKTLIPKLQPIYLSEKFKQINIDRVCNLLLKIGKVKSHLKSYQINPVPHFFF